MLNSLIKNKSIITYFIISGYGNDEKDKFGRFPYDYLSYENNQKINLINFDFILVDGDQFHGFDGIPFETVVGGDNTYVHEASSDLVEWFKANGYIKN